MLINNSFSIVEKNVSNSAEFVLGALHVDGILGEQSIDEPLLGGELLHVSSPHSTSKSIKVKS